ncbi:MAG: 4-fold beta flower protein [candidate division WOR-3 bacterium]
MEKVFSEKVLYNRYGKAVFRVRGTVIYDYLGKPRGFVVGKTVYDILGQHRGFLVALVSAADSDLAAAVSPLVDRPAFL